MMGGAVRRPINFKSRDRDTATFDCPNGDGLGVDGGPAYVA